MFKRQDGTYSAIVSSTPIHYKENNAWRDINNTLTEATVDGKNVLKNKANSFGVSLPASLSDAWEPVKVEKDGYTLSFAINDVEPTLLRSHVNANVEEAAVDKTISDVQKAARLEDRSAAIKYSSIQSDVDVEYTVLADSVKENIVLNEMPESNKEFSFTISAPDMTARLLEDNSIEFYGKDNAVVFTLPAPFMVDADNQQKRFIRITQNC